MPLRLDDGYTLKGQTSGRDQIDGSPLPVITFEYRPPRASEMADFKFRIAAATSGEEQHKIRVEFLCARLVRWDVTGRDDKPVPPSAEYVTQLPDPFVFDLVNEAAKWKPRSEESAAKNSSGA